MTEVAVLRLVGLVVTLAVTCISAGKPPIVLVPDLGGSQLDGIHYRDLRNYPFYCPKLKTWKQVWVSANELYSVFAKCLSRDLTLYFEPSSRKYLEPAHVGIRAAGFGETKSIEYLDRGLLNRDATKYFYDLVEYFVREAGYTRDVDIVAAPYDWRRSPWDMDGYFNNVKSLIERVTDRQNSPAMIISHGMGGPVMQAFFNWTASAWKDRHIAAWFPVQAAWLGAPKAAKAIISGDNLHTPAADRLLVDMERTLESTLFSLPLPVLWPKENANFVTVYDPNTTAYGVGNLPALLSALGIGNPEERLDHLIAMRQSLAQRMPGVSVYCIYGTDVATPWAYQYEKLDKSGPVKQALGDGDGTAPIHSLKYCGKWRSRQPENVTIQTYPGLEHLAAIKDRAVLRYIHGRIDDLYPSSATQAAPLHITGALSLLILLPSLLL